MRVTGLEGIRNLSLVALSGDLGRPGAEALPSTVRTPLPRDVVGGTHSGHMSAAWPGCRVRLLGQVRMRIFLHSESGAGPSTLKENWGAASEPPERQ